MKKINASDSASLVKLHPILDPYIESISVENNQMNLNGKSASYKVFPATSMVMGFQYKGRLKLLENELMTPLQISGLTGPLTSYRIFQGDHETRTILIRFKPWGAAFFFREPIHSFSNCSLGLRDLLKEDLISRTEDQLFHSEHNPVLLGTIIQNFLIELLSQNANKAPRKNLIGVINHISSNFGLKKIHEVSKEFGFSERNLERIFKEVVGLSPKKFSNIVRFQTALGSLNDPLALEKIGYYDQSHFIHDFKKFTGSSPGKMFESS